jgi:hypothetical protein
MDWKARRKGDAELAEDADIFYRQLLRIYDRSSSSVLLMEVGDQEQAIRVTKLVVLRKDIGKTNRVEIWRDFPAQEAQPGEEQEVEVEGRVIPVNGAGKMRSVVLFRVEEEKDVIWEKMEVGRRWKLGEDGSWEKMEVGRRWKLGEDGSWERSRG